MKHAGKCVRWSTGLDVFVTSFFVRFMKRSRSRNRVNVGFAWLVCFEITKVRWSLPDSCSEKGKKRKTSSLHSCNWRVEAVLFVCEFDEQRSAKWLDLYMKRSQDFHRSARWLPSLDRRRKIGVDGVWLMLKMNSRGRWETNMVGMGEVEGDGAGVFPVDEYPTSNIDFELIRWTITNDG